jgi:predicted nucleic acid-binding protein
MAKAKLYYWDSSVFCALLSNQVGADDVAHFIEEAESERVAIIVSSIIPVEVLKLKGQKPIDKAQQQKIRGFFQKDYFRWVDLTSKIGETAQALIWDNPGLWPKDAIHLASAIEFEKISGLRLDAIHSYDDDFLKLNGKLPTQAPVIRPVPDQVVMQKLLAQAKVTNPAKPKRKRLLELLPPPESKES